jgi:hypothetical protein
MNESLNVSYEIKLIKTLLELSPFHKRIKPLKNNQQLGCCDGYSFGPFIFGESFRFSVEQKSGHQSHNFI